MAAFISEKEIKEKIKQKNWDHDIQFIDGRFVEDVVEEYKQTGNEDLLLKILKNYEIYRSSVWSRAFAPYCDNDLEAGGAMYDEIVWKSALKFDMSKCEKPKGKAFNAYCVSACLNQLKNHLSAKCSHKNSPRVKCPICNEEVYQIDKRHLLHSINLERYKRNYRRYPLVSLEGNVKSPISGVEVPEITEAHLNRLNGSYTVEDFEKEYGSRIPLGPFVCPITNIKIDEPTADYPSTVMAGYDEEQFVNDFPDFAGLILCPFSGKKVLEITQKHLDNVLGQKATKERYSVERFVQEFPGATVRARQEKVVNPYTGRKVPEITLEMLRTANTTYREHVEKYAEIVLDQYYPNKVTCPFTGRKIPKITRDYLDGLGKTVYDFYHAVCKFPLRKWSVLCAVCGEWVPNIWSHLEKAQHTYAQRHTVEEFERAYGACPTRAVVSTNSFFVNESGDHVHIADLFPEEQEGFDPVEVEDSLLRAAEDDMDRRIAAAVRTAQTLEDICYQATEKLIVDLPGPHDPTQNKGLWAVLHGMTALDDFDIVKMPAAGANTVEIMMPSRATIERKLNKLKDFSDLVQEQTV